MLAGAADGVAGCRAGVKGEESLSVAWSRASAAKRSRPVFAGECALGKRVPGGGNLQRRRG